MTTSEESIPIPQPPTTWLLGNIPDIDPSNAATSFWRLADIYGPIFKLSLPGRDVIVCSNYETVNDLFDWKRFEKQVDGPLKELRALSGDGLFTAYMGEKNWGIAHRMLMPVFGPLGIRKMFPGMLDIVSQMILRWDRFGPDHEILCNDDFTRMAFDAIALCSFGYRFNNFYSDHVHPFIDQMTEVLLESGKKANRLSIENRLRVFAAAHYQQNIKAMHDLCEEIIDERIKHPPPDATDVLAAMLEGKDPETGEKMSPELIRNNMVTFLVAGHETTGGTMGFLLYHLMKNPDKYLKVQEEVDRVVGEGPLEAKHISQLVYIKYAIYEALRFMGPIALGSKHAIKTTKIAGKYEVNPEDQIFVSLRKFHNDPAIWGDDAGTYRPERWLDGGADRLPPNAFKAFGDGPRACIGRGFAEQEMIMATALIFQNFQVEMADPSYDFNLVVTLTLKLGGFRIKARRREGRTLSVLGSGLSMPGKTHTKHDSLHDVTNGGIPPAQEMKAVTVLYGSQAGTCKAYAEELVSNAVQFGFKAKAATLDSATENIPKDQPVIIISPSYEGQPADNARKFVSWLEANASSKKLEGVKYAVFSVGNSDWTDTFHRVPKLIDQLFEKMGAQRFMPTGFVDVKYDIMGPWEDWSEQMWKDLRESSGTTAAVIRGQLQVDVSSPKFAKHLGGPDISHGTVRVNKNLGGAEVGLPKKHMEVELPLGTSYRSGDYIGILPLNPQATVKRVIHRFGLQPDDEVTITGTNKSFLSPGRPTSVFDLLMARVELGTPASQKQIQALADATPENKRAKLAELAKDDVFKKDILKKRYTILDLLEDNPETQLSFASFIDMLKPLSPRQYSISSSPLANVEFVEGPDGSPMQRLTASITYDVHDEAAWSGHGQFRGVASTYLARQEPGDKVRCFTRATNANFHLPQDPTVPIILVAAGTGLAPMRGFLQERAAIKAARNIALGPAFLYFGCRHHEKDYIYADELKKWEAEGVVTLRPCFSKDDSHSGQKHVPDRIWEDREELADLFGKQGAKIFVCGSASKLAKSSAEVCKKIRRERTGESEEDANKWLDKVKEDRYVSDVFE